MPHSPSPRQKAEEQQSELLLRVASQLKSVAEEISDVDRQLHNLRRRGKRLASERQRLKKIIYEPPTFERRTGSNQGLFVHTRYLVPYIREWLDLYNSEHNGRGGLLALQHRASVNKRTISRYLSGEYQYIGIFTVDRLLTAMGRISIVDSLP